jgi:hypothetical protein
MQTPEQVLQSRMGQCWEQVELARHLFKERGVPCKTYFIDNNSGAPGELWNNYQTHTFLVFESDGGFYWFEHSWDEQNGIHRYDSLKDLLSDVMEKHIAAYEQSRGVKAQNPRIREYDAPRFPINDNDFIWHCIGGREIRVEDL